MDELIKNLDSTSELVISSKEIAKLTGKMHKNVLADCDNLNRNYLNMNMAEIAAVKHDHPTIKGKKIREMHLTKMQCFDLMTGYSAELRIKVNRRWAELESEGQSRLPNFNNPAEAARAWALEYEEKQKAVEEAKMHKKHLDETVEKVEILKGENFELEKVSRLLKNIDGDITVDVFANETSSIFKMGRNKMFSFLREHNFLFHKWSGHRSENMPYQKYIDNGTFKVVSDTYYNPKENVRNMYHISMITPKGRESLIRYIGKKLR